MGWQGWSRRRRRARSLPIGGASPWSPIEERRHPQLAGLQLELLEAANLHLREVEVQELAVRLAAQ